MFDVLITCGSKDFNKLPHCVESIKKNINGFNVIYVVSNVVYTEKAIPGVTYVLDDAVMDFSFLKLTGNNTHRKGWYKQQFIKLFQTFTNDDYLVVDADVYFNKPISILENEKPTFLLGQNQFHEPYFQLMKKVFGITKVFQHSFINEVMYFKREYVNELIKLSGMDKSVLYTKIVETINEIDHPSGFSEFETYGNFIISYYPESYNVRCVKAIGKAKKGVWTNVEIVENINKMTNGDFDLFSMHSWMNEEK